VQERVFGHDGIGGEGKGGGGKEERERRFRDWR
jgi:hypothetical protein